MNSLKRRQIIRGQMIDVSIAKTPINKSRRQRVEAAMNLRKVMAASQSVVRNSPMPVGRFT
jgi:hypothetical protein